MSLPTLGWTLFSSMLALGGYWTLQDLARRRGERKAELGLLWWPKAEVFSGRAYHRGGLWAPVDWIDC